MTLALPTHRRCDRLRLPAVVAALLALLLLIARAQVVGEGEAKDVKFPYYERGSSQMTSLLVGKRAQPQPGGKILVAELRIETYSHTPAGVRTNLVVEAPRCLVDPQRRIASSPGRMTARQTDGSLAMTGEGFEWRQTESRLFISNNVQTVIVRDRFIAGSGKP